MPGRELKLNLRAFEFTRYQYKTVLKVATTMFQLEMYLLGSSRADDRVNICLEVLSSIIYPDLVKTRMQFGAQAAVCCSVFQQVSL